MLVCVSTRSAFQQRVEGEGGGGLDISKQNVVAHASAACPCMGCWTSLNRTLSLACLPLVLVWGLSPDETVPKGKFK